MLLSYDYNGEIQTIRLERQPDGGYLASINGNDYLIHATEVSRGTWLLAYDGQRVTVYTSSKKDMRYVQLDGVQYQLEKAPGRRRRSRSASAPGDLKSEMPGQVIDVRVSEGDTVEAGQVLIVLEAMKMEIRITAPYAGTVHRLLVKNGDVIDRGQLLVEVNES